MIKYKGYFGEFTHDNESSLNPSRQTEEGVIRYHGEVVGLKDIITFQGSTLEELEKAFRDSVDDYLNWCKERGED